MRLTSFNIINKSCDEIYQEDRNNAINRGVTEELSLPYFSKKSKVGVILIHGICATPYEMMPLAKAIEESGFSVYVPLVAGHGSKIDDLIKTDFYEWYYGLNYAYSAMKNHCDKIIIIGQSNGGLLASACALHNKVDGLCLLAPAFKTNVIGFSLIKFLKFVIKSVPRKLNKEQLPFYYDSFPLKSLDDMRKFQKYISSNMSSINVPSMLSISMKDALVSSCNAIINFSHINTNDKTLYTYNNKEHNVHHILTLDRMTVIRNDILKWILRVGNE